MAPDDDTTPGVAYVARHVVTDTRLSTSARAFYGLLATFAPVRGGPFSVTRRELAAMMQADPRSVTRWARELEDAGYLATEQERPGGVPVYRLLDGREDHDPEACSRGADDHGGCNQ